MICYFILKNNIYIKIVHSVFNEYFCAKLYVMQHKEQILQVASSLFLKHGIRRVSIDDICNELRISKKTLYTFFRQKEELVEECIIFHNKELEARHKKILKNKNAIESLFIGLKEARKYMDSTSDLVILDIEKYYPHLFEKYSRMEEEKVRNSFERNYRQGVEEGYYREDLDIELLGAFHAMHLKKERSKESYALSRKFPQKRIMEFFFDMIIRLIVNEKGLKYVEEQHKKDLEK